MREVREAQEQAAALMSANEALQQELREALDKVEVTVFTPLSIIAPLLSVTMEPLCLVFAFPAFLLLLVAFLSLCMESPMTEASTCPLSPTHLGELQRLFLPRLAAEDFSEEGRFQ